VLAAIPLLVVLEIAIPEERPRLLAIGMVTAAAFAAAVWSAAAMPRLSDSPKSTGTAPHPPSGHLLPASGEKGEKLMAALGRTQFIAFGLSGMLLLRWIPLASVEWKKEWIVLAGLGLLLALSKERTPLTLALALAIGLVTPLHPGRMAFYPALVAIAQALVPWPLAGAIVLFAIAALTRYSAAALYVLGGAALLAPLAGRWSPVATRIVLVFAAVILALWPWSGAVARLLPLPVAGTAIAAVALLAASERLATILGAMLLFLVFVPQVTSGGMAALPIGAALESAQSVDIGVPPDVRSVVLRISGANVPGARPGRAVGEIVAVDRRGQRITRVLRIGDIADWGFMRREQFYVSRNVPPRNATGDLRGYGNVSFLWGAGRIPIRFAAEPASLRVVASSDLPRGAKLQVETVEYRQPTPP
jgi:MFS family permease